MSEATSVTQKQIHAWVLASRPRTLPAAISPVIVGTAFAAHDGLFAPAAALAALAVALLIQIGANFANDLYDYKRGADARGRVGPTRVTTAGLLAPDVVQRGMWLVFGLAALAGLYLVYVGGWPLLILGLASIVSAIAYTAGPFPLGYNGLGDLFVFIFFGLVAVIGTYYVQAHQISLAVVTAAVPVGALVTAILVVNNVRDVEADRASGKRTLAVLLGANAARTEYLLLLAVAYAAPFVLWLGLGYTPWVFLPLLSLPLAWRQAQTLLTITGRALNRVLGGTAQLGAIYAVLLALGVLR